MRHEVTTMMDESNLRSVFRQRAEQCAVRYDLPASVIVRTRLRLLAKTALAAAVVVVGTWTATAGNLDSIFGADASRVGPASSGGKGAPHAATPDDETGGYSFSDVSVEKAVQVPGNEGPRDLVLVRFDYAWKTKTFPGFRECLFVVHDAAGEAIGQHRPLVGFTEPEGSSLRKIDVDGDPASAQIECGPRLPGPDLGYKITNVRIDATSSWEIVVTFDTLWKGEGSVPGQSRCIASVFDAGGTTIVAHEFTFSTEADRLDDAPLSLEAPSATGRKAVRAEIICY